MGQLTVAFETDGMFPSALVNGIEVQSGGTTVQAIDCGQMPGGTLTINLTSLVNQGSLGAAGDGVLVVSCPLAVNDPGVVTSTASSTIQLQRSLTGNTRAIALSTLEGATILNGPGTAASPQWLEAMSQDLGSDGAGWIDNLVFATLSLGNNTYVKLVDQADNAPGTNREAVYVGIPGRPHRMHARPERPAHVRRRRPGLGHNHQWHAEPDHRPCPD